MTTEVDAAVSESTRAVLGEIVEQHTEIVIRRVLRDAGVYLETDEDRRESRKDFDHLRKWRRSYDGMTQKIGNFVLLAIVSGVVALIALGAKIHFRTP